MATFLPEMMSKIFCRKGMVFLAAGLVAVIVLWVLVLKPSLPVAIFDNQAPLAEGPGIETLVLTCTGCHGPGGISPGSVPSLAGRSPDELATALAGFRDGRHSGTIMKRFMVAFSDDDIAALAGYFSAQPLPESETVRPQAGSLP